jgi:transcriptional regulator NrdR family protein
MENTNPQACPCCNGKSEIRSSVVRDRSGSFQRYRICKDCGYSFTTVEISMDRWDTVKAMELAIDKVLVDLGKLDD